MTKKLKLNIEKFNISIFFQEIILNTILNIEITNTGLLAVDGRLDVTGKREVGLFRKIGFLDNQFCSSHLKYF